MRILIAVPTIDGREAHLARCVAAYRATTPLVAEAVIGDRTSLRLDWPDPDAVDVAALFVYRNRPTCGAVWNEAAEDAAAIGADALHLTADDLEPIPGPLGFYAGWFEESVGYLEQGFAPAHRIYNDKHVGADQPESHGATWGAHLAPNLPTSMVRIPTVRLAWWKPIPPIHYWSDNAVSAVLETEGIPMVTAAGAFRHHWASEGRQPGGGPVAEAESAAYAKFHRDLVAEAARKRAAGA